MTALPPWREITTDDYHPHIFPDSKGGNAWIRSNEAIHDLLQRQLDGEFRLRLILREAVDMTAAPRPTRSGSGITTPGRR